MEKRDDQIGMKGVIGVTLVTFLACLVMLAVIDSSGMQRDALALWAMLGGDDPQAVAQKPDTRRLGYHTEYDFEAYYAEKAAEEAASAQDGAEDGAEEGETSPKKAGKRQRSRLMPEVPDGLQLGNARVRTVSGKASKIEIIDIGGSMEPVDVYEEAGASVARAAPGSIPSRTKYWPMPNSRHRAATTVPSSLSTYQEVAGYIGRHASSDVERAKAIHDFIGLKLQYDYDSLKPGSRKSQQPKQVFDSGLGVCEGYARLYKAMAEELGLEAAYITGKSRAWLDQDVDNVGHAWNAVKVDGTWYLVDATWADGGGPYNTDYLFVPGEVLSATHLPSAARWQLRKNPISRAEFYRAAHLRPAFHAEGLDLISPKRGEVDVVGDLVIEIDNPANRQLFASIKPRGKSGPKRPCDVERGKRLKVNCPTKIGRQTVVFFAGPSSRSVKFVGAMHVNRR